jgi:hypothetical protein
MLVIGALAIGLSRGRGGAGSAAPVAALAADAALPPADAAIALVADAALLPADAAVPPPADAAGALPRLRPADAAVSAPLPRAPDARLPADAAVSAARTLRKVRVNARPWATFTIDGGAAQYETISTIELLPGPHRLHFSNPQLGVERDETIDVPADRDLDHVEDLRR